MGDNERVSNSFGSSSKQLDLNHISGGNGNISVRQSHFAQSFCGDGGKRVGMQPVLPYSQMVNSHQADRALSFQNFESHSRSNLSEQNVLASSGFLGGMYGFQSGEGSLASHKTHRQSVSDSVFGFSALLESSLSPSLYKSMVQEQHRGTGERKSEGEVIDELFSTYMNLDSGEGMKYSESNDKIGHGGDTSDNETEGSINESGSGNTGATIGGNQVIVKKEGMKQSAIHEAAPSRHFRSISMDSFMGSVDFGEDSLKLPPRPLKVSPSTSIDKNLNTFSLEFGKGEFSGEELKKIMSNDKLAEMALADPKRVKRILANRQSAARSKERKTRYISELEHKVHTLQSEVTNLSVQVTQLQRDSVTLSSQNSELRFRLQAMEQQAQLRNALNEALHGEVQTLKLTTQQLGLNAQSSQGMPKPQVFHIQDPKHETAQSQMSN